MTETETTATETTATGGNKTGAKALKGLELAERRAKVARMRLAGGTEETIGAALGVSAATVCRDIQYIKAQREKYAVDTLDDMRRLEDDKLAQRETRIHKAIIAATTDERRREIPIDPDLLVKFDGRLGAIAERRAKLQGLDAPTRSDVTTGGAALEIILKPIVAGESD